MSLSLPASLRAPARIEVSSFLARQILALGRERPGHRLRRKATRLLFSLVHRRLGIAAPGRMIVENGAAFAVDCANTAYLQFAALAAREGGIEPEITALFGCLAPRLRIVFDVGANWGYYPLLLGTDPQFFGEIHAFELSPSTGRDLRRTIEAAGLESRVRLHPYGLSDSDREVSISREAHSYLVRVLPHEHPGPADRAQVRRLDGLDVPAPDLIKIDVEGHEAAVLDGARGILERHRPAVIFESWYIEGQPEAMLRPLATLEGLGYVLFRVHWRAIPAGAMQGLLELEPLTARERAAISCSLNLFASHPSRPPRFS